MNTPPPPSAERSIGSAIWAGLLLLLSPFVLLGGLLGLLSHWITWPLYRWWKQRPFDSAVWKDSPPGRGCDERLWMVDDLLRTIRGRSREEVLELLGEPSPPSPFRSLLVDNPQHWQMVYALSQEKMFGRLDLIIHLDERARVQEAKVARSAT